MLYLIEILHQTTTEPVTTILTRSLYLIEILHQTTTPCLRILRSSRCILSKFYIKPQLFVLRILFHVVVSYRNSTSNHNQSPMIIVVQRVVSYRNSTSNHNFARSVITGSLVVSYRNSTSNHNYISIHNVQQRVVSYRNSTSNHNSEFATKSATPLYLIEILHQTTTYYRVFSCGRTLYLIEILHQTTTITGNRMTSMSCILSKFYIKPQLMPLY